MRKWVERVWCEVSDSKHSSVCVLGIHGTGAKSPSWLVAPSLNIRVQGFLVVEKNAKNH